MWHVCGVREVKIGLWLKSIEEMYQLEGALIHKALVEEDGKTRTGLIWLRLDTRGGLL